MAHLHGQHRVRAAIIGLGALVLAAGGTATIASAASSSGRATTKVATHHGSLGTILIGAGARTLYLWDGDGHRRSNCTGACAQAWPPAIAKGHVGVGGAAHAGLLGSIARGHGRQLTYAGHPLYYYANDTIAGQTKGEGSKAFGAEWDVVAPSGKGIDDDSSW